MLPKKLRWQKRVRTTQKRQQFSSLLLLPLFTEGEQHNCNPLHAYSACVCKATSAHFSFAEILSFVITARTDCNDPAYKHTYTQLLLLSVLQCCCAGVLISHCYRYSRLTNETDSCLFLTHNLVWSSFTRSEHKDQTKFVRQQNKTCFSQVQFIVCITRKERQQQKLENSKIKHSENSEQNFES